MHFPQVINGDLSVLIVCNKTGGAIKGDIKKKILQQAIYAPHPPHPHRSTLSLSFQNIWHVIYMLVYRWHVTDMLVYRWHVIDMLVYRQGLQ